MPPRTRLVTRLLPPLAVLAGVTASAQQARIFDDPAELRAAIAGAQRQGADARQRAEKLEREAAQANEAADKTARQAAALAARIQEIEASIAGQEANAAIVERQRQALRARLAEKQRPLVGLTAALQRLSRRPPILSLFRPGSLRDTVYLRAMLDSMLPEVERRTSALRSEIGQARQLQAQLRLAVKQMRASEAELGRRRKALTALETRQRLASRSVSGTADREAERALALAEQAKDLDALASRLDQEGELRNALARLPGPVLRPARPQDALVAAMETAPLPPAGLPVYVLPLSGKLLAGFGDSRPGLPQSRGIVLAARQGAQAVAPAPGRVAFAGPYPGYGSIVIIEHAGGWTSLVTGLAQLDIQVGDRLVAGSPLGIAGAGRPILTLELRRAGVPVNPLEYIRAL